MTGHPSVFKRKRGRGADQTCHRVRRAATHVATVAGLLTGLAGGTSVSAQRAADGASDGQRAAAFARDLEAGIANVGLSDRDFNYFISAPSGRTENLRQVTVMEALSRYPSLAEASEKVTALRKLVGSLQRRHRLKVPRTTGSDYIITDSSVEDPVLESWLTLRSAALFPGIIVEDMPIRRQPISATTAPRRWRQPIRIASTGNATFDAAIADAVRDISNRVPGAPLEAGSFPNDIENANVFIDWHGVQCPAGQRCHRTELGPELRTAQARYGGNSVQRESIDAPVFFGELKSGRWRPLNDLTFYSATAAGRRATAWIRSSPSRDIETAACAFVAGPGTSGFDTGPVPATDLAAGVRACLMATMGAPAEFPEWSVRGIPSSARDCCIPADKRPAEYSQEGLLRQLYR